MSILAIFHRIQPFTRVFINLTFDIFKLYSIRLNMNINKEFQNIHRQVPKLAKNQRKKEL